MSSFVSRFRDLRSVRKQHQLEQQEEQEKEQQQTPSWPPAPTEKKRGRATRILQTPEPSSSSSTTQQHPTTSIFNSILFNTTDAREIEKDEAARAMENNRTGALGRLQDKTQSLDQWMHHTGGRKKNDHHQQDPYSSPDHQQQSRFHPHQRNDDGGTVGRGTVINPDPIIIKGKVRRGMQNEETTNMIASEIQKRQDQREKDIQALEAGRNFHSLFSQQPKIPHGTAHVKPIWDPNDMMRTATPSRSHQQQYQHQSQQQQQNQDVNHNINNSTSGLRSEQQDISDPVYQKSSPAGLPGVGFVDQARTRHRGKHQYKTAHQLSSIVFDQNKNNSISNNNNNSNNISDTHNNNSNTDYLPGVHRKIPDGSRGLKVDPLRCQQPDSVKLAFESNPTPVRGKTQFSTTSSSIGNPGAAGELKDFVAGSTRQGPNTRHFGNQGNNYSSSQFPPIGISASTVSTQNEIHRQGFNSVYGGGSGGASSFYRSRTPFPMSSNSMIGNSGSRRHH